MKKLQDHNLRAKASKCNFLQKKVSCKNKIEAALQMAPPTTNKLLQGFLVMFNYYRMLYPTSKTNMQPLVSLTSPKIKFKRKKEANMSFNDTKGMLAHDTLLVYPDFKNLSTLILIQIKIS